MIQRTAAPNRKRLLVVSMLLALALSASAQSPLDSIGVRGGIGADFTFDGIAFGGGINKLFMDQFEVGLVFYYGSFQQISSNGVNTYVDTTQTTAVAASVNYLYGYHRNQGGFYLLGGVGIGYLGVNWEESSSTDPTLGTLLPGGGSKEDFGGGAGGALVSLGAGYAIPGGLDVRLEVPLLIAFSQTGGASTVLPMLTITAGYRLGP